MDPASQDAAAGLNNTTMAAADPTYGDDPVPAHHASPVVAFIIGLSIVLLASVLNAGGLNLTKLDHVRTSAIPKASRRKDWLRPLWLLGMLLYILSQLIGSTLALEYLRAEYVAPLGSTSLIFNFLFASMLVGTPVTSTDIYGTIVVILGVVGIVAFGSINSGLASEMDLARLKALWARGNWIAYFIVMALVLTLLFAAAVQLERVLTARADVSAVPFAGQARRRGGAGTGVRRGGWRGCVRWVAGVYAGVMDWVAVKLEEWTAPKDDKTIAWTLGLWWACCGGGLAGGCLVFAKASVKLISGKLSHENTGNQFLHVAAFATFFFLALTAVLQIICLNRGLRAYDSTLVVPVFYGVYTGTGFLNSLVFNNEVDQYHPWALFLIFVSIMVLISGVVLLTYKKPAAPPHAPTTGTGTGTGALALAAVPAARKARKDGAGAAAPHGAEALHAERGAGAGVLWELGDASDEGDDATVHGDARLSKDVDRASEVEAGAGAGAKVGLAGSTAGEEGRGLMQRGDAEGEGDADEW